ncbi:MAG: toxin-antitoxin system protein [Propionibacteriaceae bacterium]|nr:toxin-antitoxin system protein [Propionibacterium ruminifibrarum]MBE6477656.1 toxin-antitoxin system protein [Propionibacteriaceae bacterium]
MTSLTTIKVSTGTRDRLREASRAAGISQAALIEQMLDAREEAAFWEALDAAPPYTDEEREEFRRGEAASLADAARLLEDEER